MKEYTGSVYIGVTGGDLEYGSAVDSIYRLQIRPGDGAPEMHRFTKGYEARQAHINKFLDSRHAFVLLLDQDMIYPADTIERLRRHKLPYVSGLYMRRRVAPIMPVWYEPWNGSWPFVPWHKPIEHGRLHKIGASGWGCVLIHREVILSVRQYLKGENEVLEDAMTIYPYNLPRIMSALAGLRFLLAERPNDLTLYPALEAHVRALQEEIRPNRADKNDIIGSDIRFPFYALQAGYQLIGDPDVNPGHIVDYPVQASDYAGQMQDPEAIKALRDNTSRAVKKEYKRIKELRGAL